MDEGLIQGLASAIGSGLQSYRQEEDRTYKRNLDMKKFEQDKQEQDERLDLMRFQRETEKARLGLKKDENGNWIPDPESLAYRKQQSDESKADAFMRATMSEQQRKQYDQILNEKRLKAETAAKGLIETPEGEFQLGPESRAAKEAELANKKAQAGLIAAQTKKAEADAQKALRPPVKKAGESGQYIPGYQWDQKTIVSKSDIPKLQQAVADKNSLTQLLSNIKNTVQSASTTDLANPYSETSKKLKASLRDAQLLYKGKAFAELGVLAGPDLKILESVIEAPNVGNLAMGGGKEGLAKRYDDAISRVENRLGETLAARGLRKQGGLIGGQAPQSVAPKAPTGPKVGEVQKGYRFKGGDPKQQSSWEKVK